MSSERNPREAGQAEPAGNDNGSEEPDAPFHPDLTWREEVAGHRPGDRMVRIPRNRLFRTIGPGTLMPKRNAVEPQGGLARSFWLAKRFLIGRPISTADEGQERLTKVKALAVLSSDALSSVAYSTEAMMRVLILGGVAALSLTMPLTVVIVGLLAIVATSYQQTVRAYPTGGGSYIVAHENLGKLPGLVAAASLLIGYILTAAVSIAAGVDALVSAFPELHSYDIGLALAALFVLTWLNLRGIRESGTVFAAPTYVFVFALLGMLAWGLWRQSSGGIPYQPGDPGPAAGTEPLTWFLILSAFAKGCSAMTGTEAISNAVPAFQPPESRNARLTLAAMAGLLGVMVLGIAYLVTAVGLVPDPSESETVLAALTRLVVGDGWYFYLVQFATATILFLAANTSYAGFPWLLSVLARDRYVPNWFGNRGDRLAFTFGIAFLSLLSAALLVLFAGSVERLLPLYAIGVFAAFTLSQSGMVMYWLRGAAPNRLRSAIVNGVGAVATGVATLVIGVTKFTEGAWLVIFIVPVLMLLFASISGHYASVTRQLEARQPRGKPKTSPLVLVPIPDFGPLALDALDFARSLGPRVVAVHVATNPETARQLREAWAEKAKGSTLILIESPYRLLIPPLLAYIDALHEQEPDRPMLVVVPELVPKRWWEHLLHNQAALRLKFGLFFRRGVTVVNMPYHLD